MHRDMRETGQASLAFSSYELSFLGPTIPVQLWSGLHQKLPHAVEALVQ